jgi:flavin-dependent dehydrogenase
LKKTITSDILIIGGGLAGLTNAIHLSKMGFRVIVFERHAFPRHKVCGEYISNEILPYLRFLGLDPFDYGASAINRFLLSTPNGKVLSASLPLGGFGISRYTLDEQLCKLLTAKGGQIKIAQVAEVAFKDEHFELLTQKGERYEAPVAIGAFGKRSSLDVNLQRPFIQRKAPFLAVKRHYAGDFPEDLVALHNFEGGYCGVSKVEGGRINVCYLASYKAFKPYKNIEQFERQVVRQNPHLDLVFEDFEPLFPKPLSISQVSFASKSLVDRHLLMSGDAAGMIHPLCGNGMGMAISSAYLLAPLIADFLNGKSAGNRVVLEERYQKQWKKTFGKRLAAGHFFSNVFNSDKLFEYSIAALSLFPMILPFFIRQTHGEPLSVP